MSYPKCPPSYETFIDLFQHGQVKFVICSFFDKMKAPGRAECRRCHNEFVYEKNKQILVDHLKSKHYFQEENVHYVSYENYMERLCKSMSQRKSDFPPLNKRHLKMNFGVRVVDKFSLIRFPLCRKSRTIHPEKTSYKSEWQKKVCEEYTANPIGSYQGHFDRPMNTKVYMGSQPLSFSEYTEFTHTRECHEYEIDQDRYEKLHDLQKIEALQVADPSDKLEISGPCSKDRDQRVLYTCTKHLCIFPCLCKDCVEEEGQCEDHDILHPGYFDSENHAITVRMHDSYDINLVRDDFRFEMGRIVEVIKYAGIEKDVTKCVKCPRDLLHHQAYHFVHHTFCKFCENEKHKYEEAVSKKECEKSMTEKHRTAILSHLSKNL